MTHEVEHGSITEADGIHEPKGASTATSGTAYVSDGAGSGSWAKPEGTNIASTGETGAVKVLREDGDNTSSWQTVESIIVPAYAMLSNVVADSSTFAATTSPAKLTTFTVATPASGVTASHTNDEFTIVTAGLYMITFTLAATTNTPASANVATAEIYKDPLGVGSYAATSLLSKQGFTGAADAGTLNIVAVMSLAATDKLAIYITSSGSYTYDIIASQFTVHRLVGA